MEHINLGENYNEMASVEKKNLFSKNLQKSQITHV